jgi:hypothetical protein
MLARALLLILLAAGWASAAPVRFEASSLKYLYSITLDQKKDKVSGVFTRSEYGVNPVRYHFKGVVVPGSKRDSKIYVTFSRHDLKRKGPTFPPTYQGAPWTLKEGGKGNRLYVAVVVPVRSSSSPSWKVSEMEFDPVSNARRH